MACSSGRSWRSATSHTQVVSIKKCSSLSQEGEDWTDQTSAPLKCELTSLCCAILPGSWVCGLEIKSYFLSPLIILAVSYLYPVSLGFKREEKFVMLWLPVLVVICVCNWFGKVERRYVNLLVGTWSSVTFIILKLAKVQLMCMVDSGDGVSVCVCATFIRMGVCHSNISCGFSNLIFVRTYVMWSILLEPLYRHVQEKAHKRHLACSGTCMIICSVITPTFQECMKLV